MKRLLPVTAAVFAILLFFGCSNTGNDVPVVPGPFDSADAPGDVVSLMVGTEAMNMIYANNVSTSITFPFGDFDYYTATVSDKFFIGETEVSNAVMKQVLQWAYDNGRLSDTVSDHNGISAATVKYGSQELLDLDNSRIKINFASGTFSVDIPYDDYPITCVSWYGAVMFCNWLTELMDGHASNLAYSGISDSWTDDDTIVDIDQTGYRLLSHAEWEYAARYLGTTVPAVGDLATEYIALGHSGIYDLDNLTAGYYWTPCDYASGAIADTDNGTVCNEVAVSYNSIPEPSEPAAIKSLGLFSTNTLGCYDMSGNVWEWCFTEDGDYRKVNGSSYTFGWEMLDIGRDDHSTPSNRAGDIGFRLSRSK